MNRIEKSSSRVLVTGMGAVSPLGSSLPQFWEGLIAGKSGIKQITGFNPEDFPCQIAGEIPDFSAELFIDKKEIRRTPRTCQISLGAALEAMQDAGLPDQASDPERTAVIFGSIVGGIDKLEEGVMTLRNHGPSKVSPFMLPTGIPNIPAFSIAQRFNCLGENLTISTACATGTQAIGQAAEFIRNGRADIAITGGAEAIVRDWAIAGFCAMRALPLSYNVNPTFASRPFDAKREGFILSEGSGILILESEEHALKRGARVYAEIIGQASSSDAFHFAAPEPEGKGAERAMRWALSDAGISPSDVDYVNAHGTSTPLNDVTETRAIKSLFGEHSYQLSISSIKSMIGHAMGAAGALEAISTILTIYHGKIPPTINYENPDPECDLDYTPNTFRNKNVNIAISNSFGIGGQNACLVIKNISINQKLFLGNGLLT